MFGQGEIPADAAPDLPPLQRRAGAPRHAQAGRPAWSNSRKLLTIDGHPIQSNYLARYFSEFFADRARTRLFWSMASADRLGARRWNRMVYKSLTPENRELLARIVARPDGRRDRTGNAPAGRAAGPGQGGVRHARQRHDARQWPIEQREQLIAAVVASSQRIGVPCYDPTPLMNKLGQAEAMEDGGLDLTHYTPLFAERLYTDYKTFMRPRMSASAPQPAASAGRRRQRRAHREALGRRRAARGSRRLRDVLRRHPACPTIRCCSRASRKSWATTKARWRCWTAPTARWRQQGRADPDAQPFQAGPPMTWPTAGGRLVGRRDRNPGNPAHRRDLRQPSGPCRRGAGQLEAAVPHRIARRSGRHGRRRHGALAVPAATWTRRSDGSMKCARPSPPCARLRDAVARPPDRRRPRGLRALASESPALTDAEALELVIGSVLARLHHGRRRPGRVLQTGRARRRTSRLAAGAVLDLGRGRRAGPG